MDRYRPDLLVVPQDPPKWGDDHEVKPRTCARGGVSLYLAVDAFAGEARLLSHPGKDGYVHEVDVKLGEPLALPAPWDLTLDTGPLTA